MSAGLDGEQNITILQVMEFESYRLYIRQAGTLQHPQIDAEQRMGVSISLMSLRLQNSQLSISRVTKNRQQEEHAVGMVHHLPFRR